MNIMVVLDAWMVAEDDLKILNELRSRWRKEKIPFIMVWFL